MGCSAGKNQPLDHIPSTSSSAEHKAKENGIQANKKGNSNNSAHLPPKKGLERKDTGSFNDELLNGSQGNHDRHKKTSLIDYSSMKKHKDMPLSGPICNNNREISKSQTDFFKMLDERIEQGKDYNPNEVT